MIVGSIIELLTSNQRAWDDVNDIHSPFTAPRHARVIDARGREVKVHQPYQLSFFFSGVFLKLAPRLLLAILAVNDGKVFKV